MLALRTIIIVNLFFTIGVSAQIENYYSTINGQSGNALKSALNSIIDNLQKEKKLKLSKFGTFSIREKKKRLGRNPKTKEEKEIKSRNVVLFKPSKNFKKFVNLNLND